MKTRTRLGLAALVIGVLTAGGLALAEPYFQGWGKSRVSVTTSHQLFTGFAANVVSVYNDSGSDIFAMTDCTTQELATAVTANECNSIRAGNSGTFNCFGRDSISSVAVVTTNGTADADIWTF